MKSKEILKKYKAKEMILKEEFYNKLKDDKIEINRNQHPIEMSIFLSFLTIPYERSHSHLGDCSGWTKLFNTDYRLEIGGGIVNGVEYLDALQYKTKLSNQYNDYVNPFYLFEILSKAGRSFFLDYYKGEIEKIIQDKKKEIINLQSKLKTEKEILSSIISKVSQLKKH